MLLDSVGSRTSRPNPYHKAWTIGHFKIVVDHARIVHKNPVFLFMVKFYSHSIPTCSLKAMFKTSKHGIKYEYSSVQINFPKNIADKIINWGKDNIADEDVYKEEDKYGRENEIHVTVKYGLTTSKIDDIKKAVEGFGEFDISIEKVSIFSNDDKEYDVVKLDVDGEKLRKLNAILSELPNEDEHPKYSPHCTIAYVKKGKCSDLINSKDFSKTEIHVDEVEFSSLNGKKESIKIGKPSEN